MKKSILLLSLFLLLLNVNNIFSQNITIKGKIQKPIVNSQSSESESLIRLMTFNDMLTLEQSTIYETKADKDGNFTIEADIDDITLAQIAVDLDRVDILLRPNSKYEIEINIPEQNNLRCQMGKISKTAGLKNSKFLSKKGKYLFTIDTLYANMYLVKIGNYCVFPREKSHFYRVIIA